VWCSNNFADLFSYVNVCIRECVLFMLCGAELMQSSPDVSSYYEQGKAKEAQGVMFKATKRVLHNVFLSTYLRQSHSALKEGDE
jgi:hypothetical protein